MKFLVQLKITDFTDKKEQLLDRADLAASDDGRIQLDLFDSNEVGASKNVRKRRK